MALHPLQSLYLDELTDGAVAAIETSLGVNLKPTGRAQIKCQLERLLGELEGRFLLQDAERSDLHERGSLWALSRLGYEIGDKLPKVLKLAISEHGPIEVVDGELSDGLMAFEHHRAERLSELAAIRATCDAYEQRKRENALAKYEAEREKAIKNRTHRAQRITAMAKERGLDLDLNAMKIYLTKQVPLPDPVDFGLTTNDIGEP